MKKLIWVLMFIICLYGVSATGECISGICANGIWCYQESANVSTTCGNVSTLTTGNYTNDMGPYLWDGNWSTYTGATGYRYVNYSIPVVASLNGAIWRTLDGIGGIKYLNISSQYLQNGSLRCRIYINGGVTVEWSCKDNYTNYIPLRTLNSASAIAYEEGVYWDMPDTPAVMNTSYILPTIAYRNDTLQGYCSGNLSWYNNVLAGQLYYNYIWYKNGVAINNGTTATSYANATLINVANLSGVFVRTDKINLSCSAYDGITNSSWLNSTTLTISNTPAFFNQSKFTITASHQMSFNLTMNVTDIDNDALSFTSNNTMFFINATLGIIYKNATNVSTTGLYNVSLNISDGTNITTDWIMFNLTNAIPTIAQVNITPSLVNTSTDQMNCSSSTVSDADGDPPTTYYNWYNNSILTPFHTFWVLNGTHFKAGETWRCSATPWDGLVNGTEVFSQQVIINSVHQAPNVLNTNAYNYDGTLSWILHPSERRYLLNLTVNFTGDVNSTFKVYFCNNASVNASGCLGITYCNTSFINSSSQSCNYNISNYTLGASYNYYAVVIDNYSYTSSTLLGSFRVDDITAPTISTYAVSSSSPYNGDTVIFYGNCIDEDWGSNVSSVKFWVYTYLDAGATFNNNLTGTLLSGNTFTAAKAMTANGIWGYNGFYCTDARGNTVSNPAVGINITVTTYTAPAGGGGGGSSTSKKACNILLDRTSVSLTSNKVETIQFFNNDTITYTPSVLMSSEISSIEYTLPTTNILAGQYGELNLILKSQNITAGTVTLSSSACNDIVINVNQGNVLSTDLFNLNKILFTFSGYDFTVLYLLILVTIVSFIFAMTVNAGFGTKLAIIIAADLAAIIITNLIL